jgi:SAM-dependent methyltransferase
MRALGGWFRLAWKSGGSWVDEAGQGGFRRRRFRTYADYVARQKAKLAKLDLSRYDVNYRRVLGERLAGLGLVRPGASVLCLAARLGTEVKAFLDLGCFAVGIDLNPGPENRYVLHGDFHDLQFATASADVVFTNSLDHVYSLDRLLGEIARVLKPGGLLIVEAGIGSGAGKSPGHYESFWWSAVDDLISPFEAAGFTLMRREPFAAPWRGEQLCFRHGSEV